MDRRRQKQFFYGILFLLFFAILGWGVWRMVAPRGVANCDGDLQSQNGEGAGCVGASGVGAKLFVRYPISVLGLRSLNQAEILALVENQDAELGGEVQFRATLFGAADRILEEKVGNVFVPPGGSFYLLIEGIRAPLDAIARADVELGAVQMIAEGIVRHRDIALMGGATTTIVGQSRVSVGGTVMNQSASETREIELLAVLFDSSGNELFAGRTIVSNVQSFEKRSFVVNMPYDQDIAQNLDPQKTQLFVVRP